MESSYLVTLTSDRDGVVELKIGFAPGVSAQTPQLVRDAVAAIRGLKLAGGRLVKLNGPCALPVSVALAHEVAHKFAAVAVFDPKIKPGYVVCISHDPEYAVGQQLE